MPGFGESKWGLSPWGLGDENPQLRLAVGSPRPGATEVQLPLSIELLTGDAEPVDQTQLSLTVSGVTIFLGALLADGWTVQRFDGELGENTSRFVFTQTSGATPPLESGLQVNCTAAYKTLTTSWSFQLYTAFRVLAVRQLGPNHIRVTFNRPPRADQVTLTPSNYAIQIRSGAPSRPQVQRVLHTPGKSYVDLFTYRSLFRSGDYALRVDNVSDQYGEEVSLP